MLKQFSIMFAAFIFTASAQATLVDFTDSSWQTAISVGSGNTATIGNITLTSTGGNLSFNGSSSEQAGCIAGQPGNGLTCDGDGIGIQNDEITQYSNQSITIDFATAVNVSNIFLLDLFGTERTGEIAVINGDNSYQALIDNSGIGGFYATGYSAAGISSIILSGNLDSFSDYALAAIEVSPVPIPGAAILFGSALLGFFGFKRRRNV
ncbi:MAG: hypothetical protein OEW99_03595 [Gammaproteobacteria bacterium]|nr:hypothetical protein [Gammaproteobacteria bacterium]MDH5661323.1 hypothetical protein [Gammaproteobacteria bacterium]